MIFKILDKNGGLFDRLSINGKTVAEKINEYKKLKEIQKQIKIDSGELLSDQEIRKLAQQRLYHQKKESELANHLFLTSDKANAAKIDMSQYENFDTVKAGQVLGNLKSVQEEINKQGLSADQAKEHWDNYFKSLDKGQKYQSKFVQNGKLVETSVEDIQSAQAQAAISASEFNARVNQMTIGAKLASVGMQVLSIALNTIATAAISFVASKIVECLYNIATAAKQAKEDALDYSTSLANSQKENSQNAKTIMDLGDEYEELSSHVNRLGESTTLTSEQMDRYHEICNQIADFAPTLVDHYDSQGNAVLNLKGNYESLSEAVKNAQQDMANTSWTEKDDKGKKYKRNAIFENFQNQYGKRTDEVKNLPGYTYGKDNMSFQFNLSRDKWDKYFEQASKLSTSQIKKYASQQLDYNKFINNQEQGISEDTGFTEDQMMGYIVKRMGASADSTEEELQTILSNLKSGYSTFRTESQQTINELENAAQTYAQTTEGFWNDLDSTQQDFVSKILGNLNYDIIEKNGLGDETKLTGFVDNLVTNLSDSSNGVSAAFKSAMKNIDDDLSGSMNPSEIAEKYNNYIKTIADGLGLDESSIRDMMGFDDLDKVSQDYQQVITDAQNKFTEEENFDWDFWFKENSVNTKAEIQNWRDIAAEAENAAEARAKYTQEELPSIDDENIKSMRKQTEALSTALSSQSSNGYLKQTDIETLLSVDPNMEAALVDTASGMKLDPKKVKELTKQNYELRDAEAKAAEASSRMNLEKTNKEMVELAGGTENYQKLLSAIDAGNIDDVANEIGLSSEQLSNFNTLQGQANDYRGEISKWQQIQYEIQGATSLLKQYNDAQSTPNESDNYASIVSGKKNADELYKQGWITKDDFTSYANILGQYGDSEEDNIKNYKSNAKRLSKYLTEGRTGVEKFLKDSVKAGGIKQYTDENGDIQYQIDSMDKLAQKMNVTTEFAEDLIRALNDAGYSFPIEPINEYTQALDKIDYSSNDAVTSVENVIKQMQSAADGGTDVSDTFGSVSQAIEKLKETGVDTTELDKLMQKLQETQEQADKTKKASEEASKSSTGGNVDLQNRPQVSGKKMRESGWTDIENDNDTATVYTSSFSSEDGKKTVVVTPILPNGEVLSPDELDAYAQDLLSGKSDKDGIQLRTYIGDDSIDKSEKYAEALHLVQEQFYLGNEAEKASLNTLQNYTAEQLKSIDLTDNAVQDGENQLTGLISSLGLGKESASELIDVLYDMGLLKIKPEVDTSQVDQATQSENETVENSNPEVHYQADTTALDEKNQSIQNLDLTKMVTYVTNTSKLDEVNNGLQNNQSTTIRSRINGENKLITATKDQEGVIHYTADINGVLQEVKPLEDQNGHVTFDVDNSKVEAVKKENEKPTESTVVVNQQTNQTTNAQDNTGAAVDSAVNNINGKEATIKVNANTGLAIGAVGKLMRAIVNKHPIVSIKANASALRSSISSVLSRSWSIRVKANVSGMPSKLEAAGTVHPRAFGTLVKESGTAYNVLNTKAYASGTDVSLPNNETALVNEIGTEAIIRHGKLYEIPGGTHFQSLKKGDIVINAAQYQKLKEFGSTKSFAGKAYAGGTINNTNISAYGEGYNSRSKGKKLFSGNVGGSGSVSGSDKNKDKKKIAGKGGKNTSSTSKKDKSTKSTDDYLDWIEIKISRIEDEISNLDKTATSTFANWSDRLKDLNSEITKTGDEISIQQQGYDRYIKQANKVGLKESIAKLVRNGTIDITKYDDKTREKISDYQTWYDKAIACKDAIIELKEKEKELFKQKFENVATKYEGYITSIENTSNRIDELISQDEKKGLDTSANYYLAQIQAQNATRAELEKQRTEQVQTLAEGVKNGTIVEGTEAYYEMTNAIDSTTKSIMECDTQVLELNNNIRQLNWDRFDALQDKISDITSEADFLTNLMSEHELFSDEGKITDRGMATMGLYGVNYNTYMNQADRYAEEIKSINAELAKDDNKYNGDLIKRKQELIEAQRKSIESAQSEKKAIKDLVSDGFDKELSALQKLIDKYTDALDSQKDLYDYQNDMKDKSDEVSKYQKQIIAWTGDTSEEGRMNLQKAQQGLKDAKKNLESAQMDQNISAQKELLSDMYDKYEESLDDQLENIDLIVNDAVTNINANANDINNTLAAEARDVGYNLSESMATIWKDGATNEVVKAYGQRFIDNQTTICTAINGIGQYLNSKKAYEDQKAQTNVTVAQNNSGTNLVQNKVEEVRQAEVVATEQAKVNEPTIQTNPYGKTSSISGNITSKSKKKYIQSVQWTLKQLGYFNGSIDGKWSSALKKALMSFEKKSGWTEEQLSPNTVGKRTKAEFAKHGYKTGAYDLQENETAWTQENGTEAIIRKADGSILTPLVKGDSVLTADATKNMFEFFDDPNRFFTIPTGASNVTTNNIFNNSMTVNMQLQGIKDYNDLVDRMKRDPSFEKMIQAMTVDQLSGRSSLKKYRY